MRIIEDIEGHYETQEGEYGKVYRWHPQRAVVECGCGKRTTHKRTTLIASVVACECGTEDDGLPPWPPLMLPGRYGDWDRPWGAP